MRLGVDLADAEWHRRIRMLSERRVQTGRDRDERARQLAERLDEVAKLAGDGNGQDRVAGPRPHHLRQPARHRLHLDGRLQRREPEREARVVRRTVADDQDPFRARQHRRRLVQLAVRRERALERGREGLDRAPDRRLEWAQETLR